MYDSIYRTLSKWQSYKEQIIICQALCFKESMTNYKGGKSQSFFYGNEIILSPKYVSVYTNLHIWSYFVELYTWKKKSADKNW